MPKTDKQGEEKCRHLFNKKQLVFIGEDLYETMSCKKCGKEFKKLHRNN